MNYGRIVLAGVVGTVVFFVSGFLVFGLRIAKYYAPYPGVYRWAQAVQALIPVRLASTFLAILVLAAICAKGYEGGTGLVEGPRSACSSDFSWYLQSWATST